MSRIVGLDVGDARIGVAATDELGITVAPRKTVNRTVSVKDDIRIMCELLDNLDAEKVIIGYPVNQDSQEGPQAAKVRDFYERLVRRLSIPVVLWDERFSTQEAESELLNMDLTRKQRLKVIDQMAAVIILKSYLDTNQ